jgi:hypothetical protein
LKKKVVSNGGEMGWKIQRRCFEIWKVKAEQRQKAGPPPAAKDEQLKSNSNGEDKKQRPKTKATTKATTKTKCKGSSPSASLRVRMTEGG